MRTGVARVLLFPMAAVLSGFQGSMEGRRAGGPQAKVRRIGLMQALLKYMYILCRSLSNFRWNVAGMSHLYCKLQFSNPEFFIPVDFPFYVLLFQGHHIAIGVFL